MQFHEVTAFVLAGGLGTRLRSVVPDRPKALAQIHGRPFLRYLLAQIEKAGITNVVLCTGFGADQIHQVFGKSFGTIALNYSREELPVGTGGALRLALQHARSDWVLVFNGDSFAEVDLHDFWNWHSRREARASIALAEVPDTTRFGRVERNQCDEIVRFTEKGESGGAGWINAGIYLLHRTSIAEIPSGRLVSIEREVFPKLIGAGLFGYARCRRFLDIGTAESYAIAETFFAPPPD